MVSVKSIEYENLPELYITLHPQRFPTKDSFNLGIITMWFKRKGISKRYSIREIFELSSVGSCFIPSHIETDGEQMQFISSKLLLIDVDDIECKTNPEEVLKELSDICVGLFYTSSHGIAGNRYRLCFVLDENIQDENLYKSIAKQVTEKLWTLGIPAEKSFTEPLQRIRTGTKGYIMNNLHAVLPTAEYVEKYRIERERIQQEKAKKLLAYGNQQDVFIYSMQELIDRAKVIGYVHDRNEWITLGLSIKAYVEEGIIDDIEGYEIFSELCGGNDETETWKTFKSNKINIGHFIKCSNEKGFKRTFKYYHAIGSHAGNANIERVKFEKYLPTEFSLGILQAEENILVKAPTGSGKTTSFINAAKECAELYPSRFFILAVPMRMITNQVAYGKGISSIKGNTPNLFNVIKNDITQDKRVFVCTYDMAEILVDIIRNIKPFSSYTLIVDEYHQLTHNYNFRKDAIDSLYRLMKNSKGFIGLSGTPEDALRTDFDREIHVDTKDSAAPCIMWGAITYRNKNEEEPFLFQLIMQKAASGKRLLVFIQNIEMIQRLRTKLSKDGIKTAIITSQEKKSRTYNYIATNEAFPQDVQVILTTSVISDGVNIKNENNNYECIVVSSMNSPFFNVDQVRQIANRFRNPYTALYVFMQEEKKTTDYLFNIDSAFEYEKKLAENALQLITNNYSDRGSTRLFRHGRIEKRFCIEFDEFEKPSYNLLALRHNVSKEKNQFYSLYRKQFIEALEKVMEKKAKPSIDMTDYIEQQAIDVSDITEELEGLKATAKLAKSEKMDLIETLFTPAIYDAFLVNDETILKEFKAAVAPEHFACIQGIAHFTDYHICLHLVKRVRRQADINLFKNTIDAFVNIKFFESINRANATSEAYVEMCNYTGQFLSKEQKDDIAANVAKKFKKSKKVDVKHILKYYFFHEEFRTQRERFTILRILHLDRLSEMFELETDVIQKVAINYAQKQSGEIAKIVLGKL